mmetsp:Transcript_23975/g.67350  ORF Transcript_23975/g.67350 Transcript_23975/m.67350 type:complete len:105 (-) Transcript_23975:27-341(-)
MDAGMLVLELVVLWVFTIAFNNIFTTYFNSFSQERLGPGERGRFIANLMTIFTFGNSFGTLLFGWTIPETRIGTVPVIFIGISLAVRVVIFVLFSGHHDSRRCD